MQTKEFIFNGYNATVIIPDEPNGEWIWKTEFFHAFEKSELALLDDGYTRVYYEISNKYGSCEAVRLMHKFCLHVIKEFKLRDKDTALFGECKWTNEKVDVSVLETLIKRGNLFSYSNA